MTAYDFQPEFEDRILQGLKFSTLRKPRRGVGHVRVGGGMQLFTGLRRLGCRRLGETTCVLRAPVLIDAEGVRTAMPFDLRLPNTAALDLMHAWKGYDLARIAWRDGFDSWAALAEFLRSRHGEPPWALELIGWDPAPLKAQGRAAA